MIADKWQFVTPAPDIEGIIDARATLQTLPKRMIEAGIKRAEGKKLNNADKLYLCVKDIGYLNMTGLAMEK